MTGKYTHQIGMVSMSGDLSLQHPTYPRALQEAGYHTSGVGKFHLLQTWKWGVGRGKGLDLVALKPEMQKYGFDYLWETAGKQLSRSNYCEYCRYLDEKGLLGTYLDFVESAGGNSNDARSDIDEGDGEPSPVPYEDYVDVVTADVIIERIRNRPADRPFFIFGSFLSPHKPMDPPKEYLDAVEYEELDDFILGDEALPMEAKRRLWKKRRAYKGMIHLLDDQVGRILETLESEGILDRTVILFTSDHGEMMGDHLRLQKQSYYRQSVTVPLSIRHPEYLDARVADSPVEITDVTATILDLAGADCNTALAKDWPAFHDRVPCRSLMPIVRGEADSIRDYAFSECNGVWQMVQDAEWKYVRHVSYDQPGRAPEELYNLVDDPDELTNRIADPRAQDALGALRAYREYVMDTTPPAQTRWAPLPPEGDSYSYPKDPV
jgi:choline-sulfatase